MIGKTIDRVLSVFSPAWALQRMAARATMAQIQAFSGGGGSGYSAGKKNRLNKGKVGGPANENAQPIDDLQNLRYQSWSLFRNNGAAKKVVRSLLSKVVGKGFSPSSQATNSDGSAFTEFRERAQDLWFAMERCSDFRGVPGRGGLCLSQMQRLLLQSVILSGDALLQFRPITPQEQKRRGSPIPLSLQLVDSARLVEFSTFGEEVENGNQLFRGVEIDSNCRRVAYHLQRFPIGYSTPMPDETVRVTVDDMIHLFVEDDIDQMRGVPWFAAAIDQIRDTGDYQYNELKASAMAACVVLGYRKPSGASQRFGVAQDSSEDTVDDNGNQISSIQPGMVLNLGKDGAIEGFNPARPGANAEAFIQHMLRAVAGAFPGVKSSTITGDYRNSSFSSERSADNDTWPEIESLQEWYTEQALQPVYERFITDAVTLTDWFDGIITPEEFAANRVELLACAWQGPIARSINPVDDVKAATDRIHAGLSSLQRECAAVNVDWRDVIRDNAEVMAEIEKHKVLPKEFANQVLGIDAQDVIEQEAAAEAEAADDQSETDGEPADDKDAKPMPASKQKGGPASGKQTVTAP